MSAVSLYDKVVPLLRDKHMHLRYRESWLDYRFAAHSSAIPIVAGEFVEISREYPIVFAKDAKGNLGAAAIIGNSDNKNLYLDESFHWNARYIPAFIRRYPFVFGALADDRLIVCIDENSAAFSTEEGELLFNAQGEATPTLQQVLNLLHEYQRQSDLTRAFVRRLADLELLESKSMNAGLPDGRAVELDGFLMIDQKKLNAISDDVLKNLFSTGQMAMIYAHLFSVGNFLELARRQPNPLAAAQALVRKRRQTGKTPER